VVAHAFIGPRVDRSRVFLPLVVAALFSLVGLGVAAAGGERLLTTYQLRTATLDDLYDATAGGRVELEGRAEPATKILTAPFSGTECLAFTYEVEEYYPDDDGSDWHTLASGSLGVPFGLVTDGGGVLVRADERPELAISDDRTRIEVGGDEDPPERVREFVASAGVDAKETGRFDLGPLSVETGDRRRYTETRLVAGETVFVAGVARSHAAVTDVPVPDSVSAVVGPLAPTGLRGRIRRRLGGLPFTVSDASLAETATRSLVAGAAMVLFGSAFVGVGLVALLTSV
jgi:hypothetical protein